MSGLDIPLPGAPADYDNGRTYDFPADDGTAGQVMTSGGSGADAVWADAAGGAVTVLAGGDEINGYDTTGTEITQLTTVVDLSTFEPGDKIELELATNLPAGRAFMINVQDGSGSNTNAATIIPCATANNDNAVVKFNLFMLKGTYQMFATSSCFTDNNVNATKYSAINGQNLSSTAFTVRIMTTGTWNGGDGFSYLNYYNVRTVKQ